MYHHVFPGTSGTGVGSAMGQLPVRRKWLSAKLRICSTVGGSNLVALFALRFFSLIGLLYVSVGISSSGSVLPLRLLSWSMDCSSATDLWRSYLTGPMKP